MTSTDNFRARASWLILVLTAVGFLLTLLWLGRLVFLLVFAAMILAVLLSTVGSWLSKLFRLPFALGLVLFLASAAVVLGLLVWTQGPNIIEQFSQLETQLPVAFRHLLGEVGSHRWGQWLLNQSPNPAQISNGLSFAFSSIGGIVLTSATIVAGLVIVLILGLYFAAEPLLYYRGLRRLFPARFHLTLDACAHAIAQSLRWWVLAKLLSMSMVGLLVYLGLAVIGVPLAGPLGLIAAALTFIPNVGPLVAVLPALLLAMAVSPVTGLLTIGVFSGVFTLEGYLITPLLERNFVRLPPALTLCLQLLLASLAGPLGVALAAPLAAAALAIAGILLSKGRPAEEAASSE